MSGIGLRGVSAGKIILAPVEQTFVKFGKFSVFRSFSADQDSRFGNKEKKLLKTMKFPAEYSQKVNATKVNWEVMKPWIAKRVTELLGIEDEVLIAYIYEQVEGKKVCFRRTFWSQEVI